MVMSIARRRVSANVFVPRKTVHGFQDNKFYKNLRHLPRQSQITNSIKFIIVTKSRASWILSDFFGFFFPFQFTSPPPPLLFFPKKSHYCCYEHEKRPNLQGIRSSGWDYKYVKGSRTRSWHIVVRKCLGRGVEGMKEEGEAQARYGHKFRRAIGTWSSKSVVLFPADKNQYKLNAVCLNKWFLRLDSISPHHPRGTNSLGRHLETRSAYFALISGLPKKKKKKQKTQTMKILNK